MTSTSVPLNRFILIASLLALLPALVGAQPATSFAHPSFQAVWTRTDAPVASSAVKRAWFWGPQPNGAGMTEEYKEGTGGKRLVQYFDKSRMELNDPNANPNSPFYVTNGLLTVELISGRMQTGNASFVTRQPSLTNVTGDAGDPLSPSYADLNGVSNATRERRDPDRSGQSVTATLYKGGRVGSDPSKASVPGVKIAYYERTTGHNIPQATWDFLNSSGTVSVDGKLRQEKLIEPWFYASGLPISDPYWVKATIEGKATDVLVQAYERRMLTYVPTNPEGFKVEMGNIGQHYFQWRYGNASTPAPPLPRFSVDIVTDTSPVTLDQVKASGANGVRMYLSWKTLEPTNLSPDKYSWSSYDGAFKALSDRGLQSITVVHDCPDWACARPDGPLLPERVRDFADFMSALAGRYGRPPYNAHNWEFWNEPDSSSEESPPHNWGRYGSRYAEMLRTVRPGIKAADPNARIILGGIAYDNFTEQGGPFVRKFVDDLLAAGGGQQLDAFNFHYYVQNANWCSPAEKLMELKATLKIYNMDKLPIISTETGYTSEAEFNSSDDTQSLYVAQAYAQMLGEGMSSTTWFLVKDFRTEEPGAKIFRKSGLLDLSGAPKPSHRAYKVATEQMGQRPAKRALSTSDGVTGRRRGYEFSPDSAHPGPLWVIWGSDLSVTEACGTTPPPSDFVIPARLVPNLNRLLNVYGQQVPIRARGDGSITFTLGASPVYIEWAR
ncbi:MAG TPA: cellulase family glycosylhydrolase [Chloroflexia bacterium]|nr:cellulase family glycosylhydrolase [Chloroflexia bacterium]